MKNSAPPRSAAASFDRIRQDCGLAGGDDEDRWDDDPFDQDDRELDLRAEPRLPLPPAAGHARNGGEGPLVPSQVELLAWARQVEKILLGGA